MSDSTVVTIDYCEIRLGVELYIEPFSPPTWDDPGTGGFTLEDIRIGGQSVRYLFTQEQQAEVAARAFAAVEREARDDEAAIEQDKYIDTQEARGRDWRAW